MSFLIRLRSVVLLLALLLSCDPVPSSAQASYEVQGLGFLGAWFTSMYDSSGFGINNNGQAVGRSYVTYNSTPAREAFLWDPVNGLKGLGDLADGAFFSTAEAVNDAGQVAGWGNTAAGVQAFYWSEANGLLGLEGFAGTSAAYGINNSGQVVGKGYSAKGQEAFLWSLSSGLRFLGDLPGGAFQSSARAINDAGTVAGSSASSSGWQAFVWDQANGMRALEFVSGFSGCEASAVSNDNPAKIVGFCYSSTAAESCVWDAATGEIIASLGQVPGGSVRNYARSINDQGQIVGTASDGDGKSWPFIAVPGSTAGMVNVQNLITTPGWTLSDAYGINNSGTIVGSGEDPDGRSQAVILRPAACTPAVELCGDGIDNDCDTLPDCEDADCALNIDCRTCFDNGDCSWPSSGKYCEKPPGDCLGPGRCEVPPPASGFCAQELVCGCDGALYPTSCAAAREGVNVAAFGGCCLDNDGDGYSPSGGYCGLIDCDDNNSTVYPGAAEVCDAKDNDCDGAVDEIPPLIGTSRADFVFQGVQGGPAPATQMLTITNLGCGPFDWEAASDAPWLTLSRTAGGNGDSTILGVDTAGLAIGVSSAGIAIEALSSWGLDSRIVSVSLAITAEATPPTGSLLINNGAFSTKTRAVTLNLSAADTGGSGLESMRFVNSGGTRGAWEPYQSTRAWRLTSGAGAKIVGVQFKDKAGNISDADPSKAGSQSYLDKIVYDPVRPSGSLSINSGADSTNTRAVTLNISATDSGGSGLESMRFANSGGAAGDWEPYRTARAWTLTDAAGAKIVRVQFRDRAGNISDADPVEVGIQWFQDEIVYDPVRPTGSLLINNGALSTATRNVTLNISATDTGGSGLDSMRFVNGGGAVSAWEPYRTTKAWTVTGGAGTKIVGVRFKDKAGNISDADPVLAGAQMYKVSIEYTGP